MEPENIGKTNVIHKTHGFQTMWLRPRNSWIKTKEIGRSMGGGLAIWYYIYIYIYIYRALHIPFKGVYIYIYVGPNIGYIYIYVLGTSFPASLRTNSTFKGAAFKLEGGLRDSSFTSAASLNPKP